ncbi:MAG: Cgl0159 family (beta/alpha)8-fold protein [Acidimicrobiales bacterium]
MRSQDQDLLRETRYLRPESIATLAAQRPRRLSTDAGERLLIIAADHTARGVLNVGSNTMAMQNRFDLLDRLTTALSISGVHGVLGSPDIIDDLLILGALDDKLVFGSMNRGGLPGSVFEMDDRFTGYSAKSLVSSGLDGGKMLLRVNLEDPGTAEALSACSSAVTELASVQLIAMVEPFMNQHVDGRRRNVLTTDAVIRSMAIASALGSTSAFTWLKVPVVDGMERIAEASTLPIVLLGGERSDEPEEMFQRWEQALKLPAIKGLVVGRNLLYPHDDDVKSAVKTALSLL